MEKFSIQEAANSVRHCIAYFSKGKEEDTIILKANYGLYILEFLANYDGIIKAAIKLQKKDPALALLFQAFPLAEIVDIREVQEKDAKTKTA